MLELVRELGDADPGEQGVALAMSLGVELGEPTLRECALVAVPYGRSNGAGDEQASLGVLGVIGPQRMDYARIIPVLHYCSELVTRKLLA